jgi:phospholipid-translocating ATPase
VYLSLFEFLLFLPTFAFSFFAAIAILQFFPKFSTISPGLVLLPIFIVLGVTAIKDGYEDIKRHQADRHVNHSRVYVLRGGDWVNPNLMGNKARTFVRGIIPRSHRKNLQDLDALEHGTLTHNCDIEFDTQSNDGESIIEEQGEDRLSAHWKQTIWEDIRVGDIVKIKDNDSIPADMLICATSEDENVAFVETKNLDGETNLKSRSAVSALTHLRTATDCANKLNNFHVECDRPDTDMYKLNGAVVTDGKKFAIDVQMTLLRGTVLRNTGWVIGVVLFTGQDTKIVLNSSGTPSKRSKVERQINPQV